MDSERRRFPQPLSVLQLRDLPAPEERWIVPGLIPADGNVIVGGYPKSGKTLFNLLLGVSAALGRPFMGRVIPERHRVGLVLMEDRPQEIVGRLGRLTRGLGADLEALEGSLFVWSRPPLDLTNPVLMRELAEVVAALGITLLVVDSWAYVAQGDSNSADEVTPQLMRLSGLRDVTGPLTVVLTHHARKAGQRQDGERITDLLRNSSAFGAWYDAGIVLSRADEAGPVRVRTELRNGVAPEPFAFAIEDQYPDTWGEGASGWLRMTASTKSPYLLERRAQARRFIPTVTEYLEEHPGCSKRQLREGITGNTALITVALEMLVEDNRVRIEQSDTRGKAVKCYLTDQVVSSGS